MYPVASVLLSVCRRRWLVKGQVQGVGFRPFVYRLACRCKLSGYILNNEIGVVIEAQGSTDQLERFALALETERPPLASFYDVQVEAIESCSDEATFQILPSSDQSKVKRADVTVDTAVCPDCLHEMFDPNDRRHGYALINCTNCGPRFSIIQSVPYDRPNTTMASFEMCDACHQEYNNPLDHRFHAQPIACHDCGPTVDLVDLDGQSLSGDPIDQAAEMLAQGRIVAVKGIGGFHLAVNANDSQAVARLRQLKQRDAKPFALMCSSIADARRLVELSEAAVEALESPASPIVLALRPAKAPIVDAVAPGHHRLGVMLAYTPLHHLLFASLRERSDALALVMTSANLTDEPLVIDHKDALQRLVGLCDAILWHDRPIERSVDDSVLIDFGDQLLPVRRSRGYAPAPMALPVVAKSQGLCVGGELKNAVAVVRDGQAVLSQHLGDLKHTLAFEYFKKSIVDLCHLFGVEPDWVACDLHPVYLGTSHARHLAEQWNIPLIQVQHHHAHAAALMAEHDRTEPVLAVVCDGAGYGTDDTIWGGELLQADLLDFKRLARLRPLRLPGGDAAAKDIRRCALAMLHQALGDDFDKHPAALKLVGDENDRSMLAAMLQNNVHCATSSSAGRWFDGAAALLGLCEYNSYEAQAGQMLESAASQAYTSVNKPLYVIRDDEVGTQLRQIDLSPLTRYLLNATGEGGKAENLSAIFHDQLASAFVAAVTKAVNETGIHTVVLSGGVFCNQRFSLSLQQRLALHGMTVLTHRAVPPGDGGLALGQAAVAAARCRAGMVRKVGA